MYPMIFLNSDDLCAGVVSNDLNFMCIIPFYDFNDLVVDYHFKHVTNSQNEVVSIHIKTSTKAIGASYHNAFGIQLNTFPSNVTSVTGQEITKDYLDIAECCFNGNELDVL